MMRGIAGTLIVLELFLSMSLAQDSSKSVLIGPAPKTEAGGQRWALTVGINDHTNAPVMRYGVKSETKKRLITYCEAGII